MRCAVSCERWLASSRSNATPAGMVKNDCSAASRCGLERLEPAAMPVSLQPGRGCAAARAGAAPTEAEQAIGEQRTPLIKSTQSWENRRGWSRIFLGSLQTPRGCLRWQKIAAQSAAVSLGRRSGCPGHEISRHTVAISLAGSPLRTNSVTYGAMSEGMLHRSESRTIGVPGNVR